MTTALRLLIAVLALTAAAGKTFKCPTCKFINRLDFVTSGCLLDKIVSFRCSDNTVVPVNVGTNSTTPTSIASVSGWKAATVGQAFGNTTTGTSWAAYISLTPTTGTIVRFAPSSTAAFTSAQCSLYGPYAAVVYSTTAAKTPKGRINGIMIDDSDEHDHDGNGVPDHVPEEHEDEFVRDITFTTGTAPC